MYKLKLWDTQFPNRYGSRRDGVHGLLDTEWEDCRPGDHHTLECGRKEINRQILY